MEVQRMGKDSVYLYRQSIHGKWIPLIYPSFGHYTSLSMKRHHSHLLEQLLSPQRRMLLSTASDYDWLDHLVYSRHVAKNESFGTANIEIRRPKQMQHNTPNGEFESRQASRKLDIREQMGFRGGNHTSTAASWWAAHANIAYYEACLAVPSGCDVRNSLSRGRADDRRFLIFTSGSPSGQLGELCLCYTQVEAVFQTGDVLGCEKRE